MNRVIGSLLVAVLAGVPTALVAAPQAALSGFRAEAGAAVRGFAVPAEMKLRHKQPLANGMSAERYQQYKDGAEVLGGQLTIYRDASGSVTNVIGAHYPNLLSSNSVVLQSDAARTVAVKHIGGEGVWRTALMIDPKTGRFFYLVENRRDESRWFHWIDAEDGAVINAYDGLAHGSGIGVLGDIKDMNGLTTKSGGNYTLSSSNGRVLKTYDARNRSSLPGALASDSDDNWNTSGTTSPAQPALVDAQFYANVTDSYYLQTFNFNWLTHYSQGMISSAHVQRNYNNAYWNGVQMAYGDGDGTTFINFSGDLDVVGHELSHGVTEATSNLVYQNESGALNEAFSDIMGTNIEYFYGSGNWTIGEDITVGSNGIRNMANPGEDGDPSHYADRYTGTSDNGGVHTNSGIANHWYYLLVNGGQNANPLRATGTNVQGIGRVAAERVAFLGFTSLPSTATFCDARAATINVAGVNAANVADAWDEVGVDSTLCSSAGGGNNDALAPVISNVSSKVLSGGKFNIKWTTDIASDSEVRFTCCGTYTNASLVTSHSMNFNGTRGTLYEYYVSSSTNGKKSTVGPYYHQN